MITFLGNPVTLEGTALKAGDVMPDFVSVREDLSEYAPENNGKTKIYLSVPSVDTPVCSTELGKFMNYIKGRDDVEVISVSMDLPFALARWCQAQNNDNVITTSDYKDRAFSRVTGTRMAENGLLARAVFVVSPEGTIEYAEYVPEVSHEPDYAAVLKAAGIE